MINLKKLKFKLFITLLIYYELFLLFINKFIEFLSNYINI